MTLLRQLKTYLHTFITYNMAKKSQNESDLVRGRLTIIGEGLHMEVRRVCVIGVKIDI